MIVLEFCAELGEFAPRSGCGRVVMQASRVDGPQSPQPGPLQTGKRDPGGGRGSSVLLGGVGRKESPSLFPPSLASEPSRMSPSSPAQLHRLSRSVDAPARAPRAGRRACVGRSGSEP